MLSGLNTGHLTPVSMTPELSIQEGGYLCFLVISFQMHADRIQGWLD